MNLFQMQRASLAYGLTPLLEQADLTIDRGERICIVGRNGTGKSTLLKVIAGLSDLDSGQIHRTSHVKVSYMEQDPPVRDTMSIFDYVAQGLSEIGDLLIEYHRVTQILAQSEADDRTLQKLMHLQEQLDLKQGWQMNTRIDHVLMRLELDGEKTLDVLSGGWLRRVSLAKALVMDPDILLLDEPTNHIDIEMVQWLEKLLLDFSGAVVFISHDRRFIRSLATRIVDLDRGHLTSWPGHYQTYLDGKKHALEVEEKQNELFDKRLSEEERWIRQGIKARRTRNEGRVRDLKAMREQRQNRVMRQGRAKVALSEPKERSGKIIFEGEQVSYTIEENTLIDKFDILVMRGDRIALVGTNGCGKTTLIRLLLGDIQPTQGNVRCGTKLDIAYFDQTRAQLDEEKTVVDNVAFGAQEIDFQGKRRHVLGYLQDYLFDPKRARSPVKALSGGEKNRLLLAKLFLKPSNLLILDEPTNDLDVETLDLLEEKISEYPGSVLLVSHDRDFIDRTVTECWWFLGQGRIEKTVGGFADNIEFINSRKPNAAKKSVHQDEKKTPVLSKKTVGKPSLTSQMQKELQEMPSRIEKLEAELSQLQAQVSTEGFFSQPTDVTEPTLKQLAHVEEKLEEAFAKWQMLETQSSK